MSQVRAAHIWSLACDVWKSGEDAWAFLHRPHLMLDGRRPLDVAAETDKGAHRVEAILGRLKYVSAA